MLVVPREEFVNAKTLIQGFLVSLAGILLALVAVWMVVRPTGWQPIVDGNFIWKVGTIVVVTAAATAYLAAVLFVRCYEYGRTDARTEAVPVAFERGKEVGAVVTMEYVSEGTRQFNEVPDGVYRIINAVLYGSGHYLMTMGSRGEAFLVQVPNEIVEAFDLKEGFIYAFRRDVNEVMGWHVERVAR
jgi:ABC-type xylose transport system permease subunit